MIRLLIRLAIFLVSAAIALLVAAQFVDGMTLRASGFITVVVIYAAVQSLIAPFVAKMTARYANALLGGVGLIATLIALIVASMWGDALSIRGGLGSWIVTTFIVWLVTAIGTLVIPVILAKMGVQALRENRQS